jgi:hypothetical protein
VFYKNTKFKYSYKNFQVALLNSKQSNLWFYDGKKSKIDFLKLSKTIK